MRTSRKPRNGVPTILGPGLVLALWAGLASCASPGDELPPDVTTGPTIYTHLCRKCHGATGRGDGPQAQWKYLPPANFHAPASRAKSDEQLLAIIGNGVTLTPMHGYRGTLTEAQMREVIAHIRTLTERSR
jgi:mono/diheme cytochrome c family protein